MIAQLPIDFPAPRVPAAAVEQSSLPIVPDTIEGRYEVWKVTPAGVATYEAIERCVLADIAAGASRISINLVVERVRHERREPIDNSYRALLARDLRDKYPELRTIIEVRHRRAT